MTIAFDPSAHHFRATQHSLTDLSSRSHAQHHERSRDHNDVDNAVGGGREPYPPRHPSVAASAASGPHPAHVLDSEPEDEYDLDVVEHDRRLLLELGHCGEDTQCQTHQHHDQDGQVVTGRLPSTGTF